MFGSITILDPGRMNHHNEKQAQNVDDHVALATQGALAPVIAKILYARETSKPEKQDLDLSGPAA
jgi:hypothetical protein